LFISQLVEVEASAGDPQAARDRLAAIRDLPSLGVTPLALDIADALISEMALPPRAVSDAQHVGIAAVHGIDFLLTWNCRHLANAVLRDRIEGVCRSFGVAPPLICTPPSLMGERGQTGDLE
jgi:hypothetical protein